MDLSTHLTKMYGSNKNFAVMQKFCEQMAVGRSDMKERKHTRWAVIKTIYKFHDGSQLGIFLENGVPNRFEDYGNPLTPINLA